MPSTHHSAGRALQLHLEAQCGPEKPRRGCSTSLSWLRRTERTGEGSTNRAGADARRPSGSIDFDQMLDLTTKSWVARATPGPDEDVGVAGSTQRRYSCPYPAPREGHAVGGKCFDTPLSTSCTPGATSSGQTCRLHCKSALVKWGNAIAPAWTTRRTAKVKQPSARVPYVLFHNTILG